MRHDRLSYMYNTQLLQMRYDRLSYKAAMADSDTRRTCCKCVMIPTAHIYNCMTDSAKTPTCFRCELQTHLCKCTMTESVSPSFGITYAKRQVFIFAKSPIVSTSVWMFIHVHVRCRQIVLKLGHFCVFIGTLFENIRWWESVEKLIQVSQM